MKKDTEIKKINDELLNQRDSSVHMNLDPTSSAWSITRRTLMRQMAFAGLGLALPWESISGFQVRGSKKKPDDLFRVNKEGDTVVGPFGKVRVIATDEEVLPVLVEATGGLALMDFTGRKGFVRFGRDKTAIVLTVDGVKFGENTLQPWNKKVVRSLVASLVKDRQKARGAMLLRSTLHTAYPIAAKEISARKSKKPTNRRMARVMQEGIYSISVYTCRTETIIEDVVRDITEVIRTIKTVAEQYAECYDTAINSNSCNWLPPGAKEVCAAGACAIDGLVDIVTVVTRTVGKIVDHVSHEVEKCVLNLPNITVAPGQWPNPWDLSDIPLNGVIAQPRAAFGKKEIDGAIKFLKNISGFLGPFGCILEGDWSIAQLDTPLSLGEDNRTVVIPYGLKVCISKACAIQLCDVAVFFAAYAAWASALPVLAALSPEFAAATGIVPALGVAALVAALPPAVAAAAAVIFAFLLLVLFYGTAISGQLVFQRAIGSFDDHKICIVHPTFAIALVSMITLNTVSTLIPPIVSIE